MVIGISVVSIILISFGTPLLSDGHVGAQGDLDPVPRISDLRPSQPTISMMMSPDEKRAEIDQTEGDILTFEGYFSVQQGDLQSSSVSVAVDVSTGWSGAAEPNSFDLTGPDSGTFWVTVVVPSGASADEVASAVAVASCTSSGFETVEASDAVQITVGLYMHMSVQTTSNSDTVKRGESTTFTCDVTNRGNGKMTFWVTAESTKGIGVELSDSSINVEAGKTGSFTLTVSVGLEVPPGSYDVVVNVMGETGNQRPTVSDSVSFSVEVPSKTQVYGTSVIAGVVLIAVLVIGVFVYRRRRE
jgi:uncharacterized membrane protein